MSRRSAARWLLVGLAVLYLAAGVWTTRRTPATGDEVTYLMAADALVRGEGLDLTARWQAIDGATYSPGDPIPADEFARTTAPSRARPGAYPIHDLGLPLLAALPLALGGRALVVALVGLGMAAAVACGMRVALALGAPRRAALVGGAATGLSAPALTYSGQVFADAVAPLAVGAALAVLAGRAPRWALGLALAALPVLHVRYWPIAAGLALAALVVLRPSRRELVTLAAPTLVAVAALTLLDLAVYGLALPHAGFLLFFLDRRTPIETYSGVQGSLGLFVDRAFGLLPAAPVALLLFVGAGAALVRPRERPLVLALLPYVLVVPFVDWTGGFSPQARYLAPLVPLFPLLIARGLERIAAARGVVLRRVLGSAAALLALWTLGQSAVYAVAPWLRYDGYAVPPLADRAWAQVLGLTPSAVFPLFGAGGSTTLLAGLWAAALLMLVIAGARGGRAAEG